MRWEGILFIVWLYNKKPIIKQKLTRDRKIDKKRLLQRVKENPEDRLIDHAKAFDGEISTIGYPFQTLDITLKKTQKYKERKPKQGSERLRYFKNRLNSGFVEGFNNKIKGIKRRCLWHF